jgi:hypothetical protein
MLGLLLTITAPASLTAPASSQITITLVAAGSGGWRHLIGAHGSTPNFEGIDFQDQGWLIAGAPFATGGGYCGYPQVTYWPLNTDLLLRRRIMVPAPCSIVFTATIDNDVQAFMDGVAMGPFGEYGGCAWSNTYQAAATVDEAGERLIAVRARDRGGVAFCDVRIEATFTADCNGDGFVDYGQILQGLLPDIDGNGIPDSCDCPADLDLSGSIDAEDLSYILFAWGTDGGKTPKADINRDGIVDAADLAAILSSWGSCP